MAKMRKVDSYVVLGELQFYNCLNCPWSPNVSPEKTKEVEVVNASLPRGIQYIYVGVENMYELEVTACENIFASSMFLGIITQTILVATRKKTRVNDLLLSVDSLSLKNKAENKYMMIVAQKQIKRTAIGYRMTLHPTKQFLMQVESKTNNLANKDVLSLLQYLTRVSNTSEAERFMPISLSDRVAQEGREKYTRIFNLLIQLDSPSVCSLYPNLKELHHFGTKFISYSFHEIVLGVAKEHLIRHLQKLKDSMFNSYCNLLCIKELHFFMEFHQYLYNDSLFKMVNKSQVKPYVSHITSISKTRSSEMHDCMMLLREAPKFLSPLSCSDGKGSSFIEFTGSSSDNCVARVENFLQKSTPFRTSSYFIPANFSFSETYVQKRKANIDKNTLLDSKHHINERISERVCNILSCQLISFTRWDMIESIADIIKVNYHDVRNSKEKTTIPLSQNEFIAADSEPSLVTWSDIGGLDAAKQLIRTTVKLPTMYDKLFENQNKGLILYGPPGTGKTLLARAISNECELKFFMIKGPEVIDMYVGESERHLRQIFHEAKISAPSIIFFDEIDALATKRVENENLNSTSRVVSQLILEIDDVLNFQNIFIMGATNRPDRIDTALLRPGRFDKLIYVGIDPSVEGKIQIMESLTRRMKLAPGINFSSFAETHASRYSGADLYSVCADSWLRASKRRIRRKQWSSETEVVVEMEDFVSSFADLKPSLSQELIEYYEDLNSSFI